MNNNKGLLITLITLLSIVIILLVLFLVAALSKNIELPTNFIEVSSSSKLIYNEDYDMTSISNIKINTMSSDITFKESSSNNINLKVYGSKKKYITVNNFNNTLSINYEKIYTCIGICNINNKIVVEIPKNYNGKIKLSTKSGDINLSSINAEEFNIETISGDIDTKECKNVVAKTISGEINISKITSYGKILTTSGDIKIGSINLSKDSIINSISGEVEVGLIEDIYVSANSTSGDIKINNNNRKATHELTIKTISGDIDVG